MVFKSRIHYCIEDGKQHYSKLVDCCRRHDIDATTPIHKFTTLIAYPSERAEHGIAFQVILFWGRVVVCVTSHFIELIVHFSWVVFLSLTYSILTTQKNQQGAQGACYKQIGKPKAKDGMVIKVRLFFVWVTYMNATY